jgi:hypothetical protein
MVPVFVQVIRRVSPARQVTPAAGDVTTIDWLKARAADKKQKIKRKIEFFLGIVFLPFVFVLFISRGFSGSQSPTPPCSSLDILKSTPI